MSTQRTPIGLCPVALKHSAIGTFSYTFMLLKYSISSRRAFLTIPGINASPDVSSNACMPLPSWRSSLAFLPTAMSTSMLSQSISAIDMSPSCLNFFSAAMPSHIRLLNCRG